MTAKSLELNYKYFIYKYHMLTVENSEDKEMIKS